MATIGPGRLGLTLAIELPGADPFVLALSRFSNDLGDYRPFWDGPFKTLWYEERRREFALGGLGTGLGSWADLSPAYRAWKGQHYPGRPTLTRTGRLAASLTTPTGRDSIWRSEPTSLTVGTADPVGWFHQMGTRRMPARPPLRIAPGFMRVIGQSLQEFAVAAWKQRRHEGASYSGA